MSGAEAIRVHDEKCQAQEFRAHEDDPYVLILGRYLESEHGTHKFDLIGDELYSAIETIYFTIDLSQEGTSLIGGIEPRRTRQRNQLFDFLRANGIHVNSIQDGALYWPAKGREYAPSQIVIWPHWTRGLVKRRLELLHGRPRLNVRKLIHQHAERYK